MGKKISEISKFKEGRGTSNGGSADYGGNGYKAWITSGELNSIGTAESVYDYKTGRMVQCLSQGEKWFFYKLRFSEKVKDIKEQFPLTPLQETIDITAEKGYKGSFNNNVIMTTDFLVTRIDDSMFALSVKVSESKVSKRQKELLDVEREYWERRGVPFFMGYKDTLNPIEIMNIESVVDTYDWNKVFDDFSLARYLIANHLISVDMTEKELDFAEIVEKYKETEIWLSKKSLMAH